MSGTSEVLNKLGEGVQPTFKPQLVTRSRAAARPQVRLGTSGVFYFPLGCPSRKGQGHEDERSGTIDLS